MTSSTKYRIYDTLKVLIVIVLGTYLWLDGWERFSEFRMRKAGFPAGQAESFLRLFPKSGHVPNVIRRVLKEASTPRIQETAGLWRRLQGREAAGRIPEIAWEKVRTVPECNAWWSFAVSFPNTPQAGAAWTELHSVIGECPPERAKEFFLIWYMNRSEKEYPSEWPALLACLARQTADGSLKDAWRLEAMAESPDRNLALAARIQLAP